MQVVVKRVVLTSLWQTMYKTSSSSRCTLCGPQKVAHVPIKPTKGAETATVWAAAEDPAIFPSETLL
jgi:hypothetical protein